MTASNFQKREEVRIAHSLNQNEKNFTDKRKDKIAQSLKKLWIWCSRDEVPNIALLGSGGGQRAMVALLGSLVQLSKAGLLDYVLYLSGVSGSTWCMASLYQEPDWSSKLGTVKDKIVQRLSGPAVSWLKAVAKLCNYWKETDIFSLTDLWAILAITTYVKEIDEDTLWDHWSQNSKDPYPIYTLIDKGCKIEKDGDPWFEITPHEAGYSLTGAFVDTYDFGSQFNEGSKIKKKPQMDLLYLQALCGSAIADPGEIKNFICEKIKESGCQTIVDLLEAILKSPAKPILKQSACQYVDSNFPKLRDGIQNLKKIADGIAELPWGRTYNFLHNMADEAVPAALRKTETRDFIDAGLLNNSPYIPVLRKERNIDLIISLDFSEGDPFRTVKEAAKMCKDLNIPFPGVHISKDDINKPKDFYVFKGENVPTVIHIPLFNVINCGDKLEHFRLKYGTLQGPYSAEMIKDLMAVAGKNISNNKKKLREEIRAAVKQENKSKMQDREKLTEMIRRFRDRQGDGG